MLVRNPHNIRLAMIGMVDGNGHPYSWSAIINGRYDARALSESGFPVIGQYLAAQPAGALGIPGARVTHVWCDEPADAERVARAAYVSNVVERSEDVIGHVDAVVIPTDRGWEHVERCRPFVEAGLPLLIDKPLCDGEEDLRQFVRWQRSGAPLMSMSCMRYAREFEGLRARLGEIGELRFACATTPKSWERYGIHALEGVYPFLPAGGWEWVANTGSDKANVVHAHHASNADVVIAAVDDMFAPFSLSLHGTRGELKASLADRFYPFKKQLDGFVNYLRTGEPPFPFDETIELTKIVIAGIRSRDADGRRVPLSEISV